MDIDKIKKQIEEDEIEVKKDEEIKNLVDKVNNHVLDELKLIQSKPFGIKGWHMPLNKKF